MAETTPPPSEYRPARTSRRPRWLAPDLVVSAVLVSLALTAAWGVTIVGAATSGEVASSELASTQLELANDTSPTEPDSSTITPESTPSTTEGQADTTTSTSIVLGTVRTATDYSSDLRTQLEDRSVYVLGDSLVLSASDELRSIIGDNLTIDAEAGLGLYYAAGRIELAAVNADIVVVSLGTNDFNEPEAFVDSVAGALVTLAAANCVIWVDTQTFQPGLVAINDGIVSEATAAGRLVAGWSQLSGNDFPERHAGDGYHLSFEGQEVFASLIATTVETGCL